MPKQDGEKKVLKDKKSYYTKYYKNLGDTIMINPEKEDNRINGIIVPDAALPPLQRALVIKVGPGVHNEEVPVKAGDMIIFPRGAGYEFQFQEVTYRMIRSRDAKAII